MRNKTGLLEMIRRYSFFLKLFFKKVNFFDLAFIMCFFGLGLSSCASAHGDQVIQKIDSKEAVDLGSKKRQTLNVIPMKMNDRLSS